MSLLHNAVRRAYDLRAYFLFSGTGNFDGRIEEKTADILSFEGQSASAEGKSGNTDLTSVCLLGYIAASLS